MSPARTEESPKRVLIVDDEPQIRRVLRLTLTAQGFDVRGGGRGSRPRPPTRLAP